MAGNESSSHIYALRPGTMLHEFQIEAVLGHGGFGITYKALDTALDKAVAIKEYLPNDLASRESDSTIRARSRGDQQQFESGVAAFLDEARLVARLRHRNIMEVLRFFKANGTGYIVLGYEQGRTLKQRLDEGTLSEAELRKVLGGLLDGIEVLHNEAILHRDIKPSNIILSDSRVPGERGVPVLIDFGAARDFRSRHSRSVTTIVAPGYAPPEQYGIGGQAGPWSDLYALGATAYRCATGEAPPEALRRLRTDPCVPAVKAAAGRYDPALLHLIDRMLSVEEADRPQSVAEVRVALRSRGPLPRDARRAGAAPHASAPSRSRRVAGFVGAIAVAAIAAFGATWWSGGTMPQWFSQLQTRIAAGTLPATPVAPATPAVPSTNTAAATVAPQPPEPPKAEPRPVDEVKPAEASPSDAAPKADQVTKPDTAAKAAETPPKVDAPTKPVEAPGADTPLKLATAAPAQAIEPPVVKRTIVDAMAAGYVPIISPGRFEDGVRSVAFSPDGRIIAGVSRDGVIRLWDVTHGRAVRTLAAGKATAVAFSTDRRTLAVSCDGCTDITLWDVASGRELRKLSASDSYGRQYRFTSLAFSPDGHTLVASTDNEKVKAWDAAGGRALYEFRGNGITDNANSVAFSPDGRILVAGARHLELWDVAGRRLMRTLTDPASALSAWPSTFSVVFSSDGRTLASASYSVDKNRVFEHTLWDVASGRVLRRLKAYDSFTNLAFSPDGHSLASHTGSKEVTLWDVASGRELRKFRLEYTPDSLAFSPGGRTLAISGSFTEFWSIADGSLQARYVRRAANSISFDGKGMPIAVSGDENAVYHFVKDGKKVSVSEMRAMGYELPGPH